ncbi:MAG: hypothetical protein ACM35H_12820, partial [Bacteroidota bacterium]
MLLLASCAGGAGAGRSTSFGPSSKMAIVVIGTSANAAQVLRDSGESLSTFWQQYDPLARRLIPGGNTIQTKVFKRPFTPFIAADRGYVDPTVTVLEALPGDYALTAAGFPHVMTLFVRARGGNRQAGTYVVDPTKHVDPKAEVNPRSNYVFSVAAGQIIYIGHFQFVKAPLWDSISSISYSLDPVAARAALDQY